jgi:transcription elongation factor Elf1
MIENNIVLDDKIKCLNCNHTLALRNIEDDSLYIPSDIEVLNHKNGVKSLKCNRCGLFTHIKPQED